MSITLTEIQAVLSLRDSLTPAMKAAAANAAAAAKSMEPAFVSTGAAVEKFAAGSVRSLGSVSTELLLAQKHVAELNKAIMQDSAGGNIASLHAYAAMLDDAIPKVSSLQKELAGYTKAATDSATATQKLPATGVNKWFGDLGTQIMTTAAGFISAQAVIGAVTGTFHVLAGFVGDSVKAYAEAEAAQKKLTTAMRAQGTASAENVGKFNALAAQFQRTTAFSDDLINSSEALLIEIGDVMPDKMEGALKASANLAAGLGMDLETATRLVAKAAAGHTETLGRYGITVDQVALKTKGFDAVLDAVNKQFGGQAAAQLDTYAGRLESMKNSWNNLQEAVGKMVVTNPIVEAGLRTMSDALMHLDAKTGEADVSLSRLLARMGAENVGLVVAFFEGWASSANDAAAATKRLADLGLKPMASHLENVPPMASHDTAAANKQAAQDADVARRVAELAAIANEHLTKTQQDQIASLAKWGESEENIAKLVHVSTQAVHLYEEKLKATAATAKKFGEASEAVADAQAGLGSVLGSLDYTTRLYVQHLLGLGVEQGKIATALHLTEAQVKAVASGMKLNADVVDIATNAYIANEAELRKIGTVEDEEIRLLKERFAWQDKLRQIETMSPKQLTSGLENIGTPTQPVPDEWLLKIAEADRRAKDLKDGLKNLTTAFSTLAQISGDSFGGALKGVGQVVGAIDLASTATKLFASVTDASGHTVHASWLNMAAGAATYVGIAMTVMNALSAASKKRLAEETAIIGKYLETLKQIQAVAGTSPSTGISDIQRLAPWKAGMTPEQLQNLGVGEAAIERYTAAFDRWQEALRNPGDTNELFGSLTALTGAFNALTPQLEHFLKLRDEASSRFGPSHSELVAIAQDAHEVFDSMLKDGGYTAEQLTAAYLAFQQAMAAAGNEAAIAWLKTQENATKGAAMVTKALEELKSKRESLAQSVANEAPEDVMGVIEAQTRGQMAALDAQIDAQTRNLAAQAGDVAGTIEDTLNGIKIETIDVPYEFRQVGPGIPGVPGGFQVPAGAASLPWANGEAPEDIPGIHEMAKGGSGRATGPALFYTKGNEDFAFSGEGKSFGGGGTFVIQVDARESFYDNPASIERLANRVGEAVMRQSRRTLRQW